jgi:hypothetical protein
MLRVWGLLLQPHQPHLSTISPSIKDCSVTAFAIANIYNKDWIISRYSKECHLGTDHMTQATQPNQMLSLATNHREPCLKQSF